MLFNYNSFFYSTVDREYEDGGMFAVEPENLAFFLEKQNVLEERLKKMRENEPSRKRKNRSMYKVWIDETQDLLDELRVVRDKIVLLKKQSE